MIRKAIREDISILQNMWIKEYGLEFTKQYLEKYILNYETYVLEEDEKIIASISYRECQYVLGGKILKSPYILKPIGDIYSEKGKSLLFEVLKQISTLEMLTFMPYEDNPFYKSLGFENIYKRKKYILNTNNIPTLNHCDVSFSASNIDMLKCYGAFTSYFNGYKLRNEKDFQELKEYKISKGAKYIYFYKDNDLKAYASYYDQGDVAEIDEIIYLDSLSFVSIISYLLRSFKDVEVSISAGENLDFLAKNLHYEEYDFLMARVNDYAAFNRLYNCNVSSVVQAYMISRKHPYIAETY